MIYLDCAATSLQKPREVIRSVERAMTAMTSPGRGGHKAAMAAAEAVFSCREAAAELFHVPNPEQVVFTFNATHGLNIAIYDLVASGDSVIVSGYEHNSVMRPLYHIGAKVHIVRSPLFDAEAMTEEFAKHLPKAKAAVCTAMSNVYGFRTPIKEISKLCKEYGVPLIIDASQLAGAGKIDFAALGAAYIAMPGHKGLLGPQGTGLLLCGNVPNPLIAGGTGTDSKSLGMPTVLPDVAEAGTHNVHGIAGLEAGIRFVQRLGVPTIESRERRLLEGFQAYVSKIDGLETFFSPQPSLQGGVLSVRHKKIDCELIAEALDRAGIAVRGGMHCAPCAHKTGGTYESGTVRFSFSPFNTVKEVEYAARVLERCVNKEKT
ncbi:MAG: aminotransferase class V-fold PLP-dependent enzyme [Oscillospiraceae bacterium]|nr:aminotransferase class V-fold PLP-dependent enzyme [Oscillospiraceae bacterium]